MSRRFRDGICAYCGQPGDSADHVFSRKFFPICHRNDLPQVAACEACNGAKGSIENYLLAVLPLGGRHPLSRSILEEMVPSRLAGNQKLHRKLASERLGVSVVERGVSRKSLAIPFESDLFFAYFRYVARGLAAYHWKVIIPRDHPVSTGVVTAEQDAILRSLFLTEGQAYARADLGDGLILYEGKQAADRPFLTIWRFRIYGALVFTGDDNVQGAIQSDVWAITDTETMPGLSAS